jgi:hypothetical protein
MRAVLLIAAVLAAFSTAAFAAAPADTLTDDALVALTQGMLDINNLRDINDRSHEPNLAGRIYHGQRLSIVREDLGLARTIGFDLPRGVSCKAVGGVAETYYVGDYVPSPRNACVPKVLVDRKLDSGVAVLGPEFTDDALKAFAAEFFRHAEYRKLPPAKVQHYVAGTYRGRWVTTEILCDVVGSAEPQCLQADAPLIVSLTGGDSIGDKLDCPADLGMRVRYEAPNEYKSARVLACVPKVLLASDLWKQGLTPGAKAEILP